MDPRNTDHKSCPSGAVCIGNVAGETYADPSQCDPISDSQHQCPFPVVPRWSAKPVIFASTIQRLMALAELRAWADLADLELFRRNRLSVVPVAAST